GWTGYDWDGKSSIYLFDRASGAMVRRIGGLPGVVTSLIFSLDGKRIAAGLSGGNGVRVFQAADGSAAFSDDQYKGSVFGLEFDNGGRLASSCEDFFLRLYGPGGQQLAKVKAAHGEPYGIAFSPDGERLAVGYFDSPSVDVLSGGLAPLFSAATGDASRTLFRVRWSLDGRVLAASGQFNRNNRYLVRRWSEGGRGPAQDTEVGDITIEDLAPLSGGAFAVASDEPRLSI